MPFTYIGSSVSPADGGTQLNAAPTALAIAMSRTLNTGAIQTGDLVAIWAMDSAGVTGRDFYVDNDAGQSWSYGPLNDENGGQMHRVIWCQAKGPFSVDPTIGITNDNWFGNYSLAMDVFRPSSPSNLVGVDVAGSVGTFADPSSPFDLTVPGQTTVAASSLTLALVHSYLAATYSTLTAGWNFAGPAAQQRNGAMSGARIYKINTSAGATGSFTVRQATNHAQGLRTIITFKETAASAGNSSNTNRRRRAA